MIYWLNSLFLDKKIFMNKIYPSLSIFFLVMVSHLICAQTINNSCSNAQTIVPGLSCSIIAASFQGATNSAPAPSCAPNTSQDIWFKFIATTKTNRIELSASSSLNHGFEIFEGSCTGTSIRCINNTGSNAVETDLFNNFTIDTTYYIRVFNANSSISASNFTICVQSIPIPTNNECSNAQVIVPNSSCVSTSATLAGTDMDLLSPTCASDASQNVWFQFTASESTNRIELSAVSGLNHGFEIFEGNCASNAIHCINNTGINSVESIFLNTFQVGTTYYIRIFNAAPALTTSNFNLCVQSYPDSPINDCFDAQAIVPSTTCDIISSSFTGSSLSQSPPGCAANASQDIWFTFLASEPSLKIQLNGATGLDHGYELILDNCSGSVIDCKNSSGAGAMEIGLYNDLIVGENYFIRVFNVSSNLSATNFNLCVQSFVTPINNDCNDASEIIPTTSCTFISSTFAGSNLSMPSLNCGQNSSQDVWFKFVANTETFRFVLPSVSGVDHGFEIFEASCLGSSIHCINNTGTGAAESAILGGFNVDTTYYVRVFNTNANLVLSNFSLCIQAQPENNICENAEVIIPSLTFSYNLGTLAVADLNTAAPQCGPNASQDIWFQFVAISETKFIELPAIFNLNHGFEIRSDSCSGNIMHCRNVGSSGQSGIYNDFIIGNVYYIRVFNATSTLSVANIMLMVLAYPTPINNNCVDAEVIMTSSLSATISTNFSGASMDSSPPNCALNASQDIWYQFTATVEKYSVKTQSNNTNLNHGFEILENTCNGPVLHCVNNFSGAQTETGLFNDFTIGNTYFIRVFNANSALTNANITLIVNGFAEPVNNDCSNATLIQPASFCSNTISSLGGSNSIFPPPTCAPNTSQDVWFKFIATTESNFIQLNGVTNLNHGFEIYENSCAGNIMHCQNQGGSGGWESKIYNDFTVATTYYIRVFNAQAALSISNISICVVEYTTPPNNDCSNAQMIVPGEVCTSIQGTFAGTSIQPTVPSCNSNSVQDIWYQFVATTDVIFIQLTGTGANHFEIIEGSCNGQVLHCMNTTTSATLTNFSIGETYYIRIFRPQGALSSQNFTLCVQTPLHNSCEFALSINPQNECNNIPLSFFGTNLSSTPVTCASSASQDVWVKFVAELETYRVHLPAIWPLNHGFEIYQGTCNGSIISCVNAATSNQAETLIWNNFIVGETYYVRIFNASSNLSTITFNVCIQAMPAPLNDECQNATVLIPSPYNLPLTSTFSGSTLTASIPSCATNASQDLWYQFTATQSIMVVNVQLPSSSGGFEIFEGSCTNSPLNCTNAFSSSYSNYTLNNANVGTIYYVRVFNNSSIINTLNCNIYINGAVPSDCVPTAP